MPNLTRSLLFAAPLAILVLAGCSQSPSADPKLVAEHRARLTLAEEPPGAQPVQAVRYAMYGVNAEENPEPDHAEHDHPEHADHDHAEHAEEHDHDHEHELDPTAGKTPVVSEMDVVLTGVVGGLPNPSEQSIPDFPFSKGKAVIFVADPHAVAEMAEHDHHHAPGEECSFCAAHSGDSARYLAVVHFTDAAGKPVQIDARDLFGLKEKQQVVVRGKAKVDPSGLLTVAANGLYIRK